MSGERVRLVDEGGSITRLVDALASVVGRSAGSAALIGGLAVLGRIGGAYGVTNDVDAVAEPDALAGSSPSAARPSARPGRSTA